MSKRGRGRARRPSARVASGRAERDEPFTGCVVRCEAAADIAAFDFGVRRQPALFHVGEDAGNARTERPRQLTVAASVGFVQQITEAVDLIDRQRRLVGEVGEPSAKAIPPRGSCCCQCRRATSTVASSREVSMGGSPLVRGRPPYVSRRPRASSGSKLGNLAISLTTPAPRASLNCPAKAAIISFHSPTSRARASTSRASQ